MDRLETRCWLDWWANSSTLIDSVAAEVVITASGTEWSALGRVINDTNDVLEGFTFLCDLDPVFELRFDGGDTVTVTVHDLDQGGRRFALTEYREQG